MTYSTLVVDSNCVAHMELQDNAASTTVVDTRGLTTGVLSAAAGNTSAAAGATDHPWLSRSLFLNGSNDKIDLTSIDIYEKSGVSFGLWIKPTTIGEILGRWSGASPTATTILLRNATLQCFVGDATPPAPVTSYGPALAGTLSTGVWSFLAVVSDGSTFKLGINNSWGTPVAVTGPLFNSSFYASLGISIGKCHSGTASVASFADFTAFSRALSDAEFTTLYNGPSGGSATLFRRSLSNRIGSR